MEQRNVACQLFYGFFLPGDTEETVQQTLRFAHEQESPLRESFYLAFSTDPGSSIQTTPDQHDMVVSVRTLRDYLDALAKPRLSPNLLAHRPASMSEEHAAELELRVTLDQFLYKLCPAALLRMRVLLDKDRFYSTVARLASALARVAIDGAMTLPMPRAVEVVQQVIRAEGVPEADLLGELVAYEAGPYLLLEEHFGKVGMHYSSYCEEAGLSRDELSALRHRPDVAVAERSFAYDVKDAVARILAGHATLPPSAPASVGVVVEQIGRHATWYVDEVPSHG